MKQSKKKLNYVMHFEIKELSVNMGDSMSLNEYSK